MTAKNLAESGEPASTPPQCKPNLPQRIPVMEDEPDTASVRAKIVPLPTWQIQPLADRFGL